MKNENELRSILDQMKAIRGRSEDSFGMEQLLQRDRPKLQRLLTEAKAAIAVELGDDNDFARYLTQTVDRTVHRDVTPEHADEGLEFIEGALNQIKRKRLRETGLDGDDIPASDRYVSIADNQRAELKSELETLQNEARGANDVDEEDRLIALSEIAVFEATIVQQRISTDLIQRFVDTVLGWIERTFTAAAVQDVAQRLIHARLKLIT